MTKKGTKMTFREYWEQEKREGTKERIIENDKHEILEILRKE